MPTHFLDLMLWVRCYQPTITNGNECNYFFFIPTGWLSMESLNIRYVLCIFIWLLVCVCACDVLFLRYVCMSCGSDSEQQGLRESLLTGSDGKLWNENKASCHYRTDSLSRTCRHTGKHSKTAMITDKRANNVSLAGRLNSNCRERHT